MWLVVAIVDAVIQGFLMGGGWGEGVWTLGGEVEGLLIVARGGGGADWAEGGVDDHSRGGEG